MTGLERSISGGTAESEAAKILVVGKSRINLVVVSEIVHRCGLRAVSTSIEDAAAHFSTRRPQLVILDGGADNRDCDTLVEHIAALQRTSEAREPRVVLLSTRITTPDQVGFAAVVDEVVAKPITPERLQPVVERLVRRKG